MSRWTITKNQLTVFHNVWFSNKLNDFWTTCMRPNIVSLFYQNFNKLSSIFHVILFS